MRYLALLPLLISTTTLADSLDAHPTLSTNGSWVPVMLIIVAGMFLAAAVIGPIVRANMPEEIPPSAHSHDEPAHPSNQHDTGGSAHPAPEHDSHH
jgi:hypothetical protein